MVNMQLNMLNISLGFLTAIRCDMVKVYVGMVLVNDPHDMVNVYVDMIHDS
jgi:hypothetical protein